MQIRKEFTKDNGSILFLTYNNVELIILFHRFHCKNFNCYCI